MEYRKLIKFGNSSSVVSLPKSWLEKNKLNKGDVVYIDEKENDLVISLKSKDDSIDNKEATIDVTGKDIPRIWREITSAYIDNYHTINLLGEHLESKAKDIREGLHNLMALEIMEQTATKIVAKDFLNMKEISVANLIRKLDIIVRAMISDSKQTIKEDLYENINHRDQDVNRLSFLAFRAIKYALNNHSFAKSAGLTPEILLNYWRIVNCLEEIGDQAKRIARHLKEFKSKIKPQDEKRIMEIYSEIEKHYLAAMKAFYTQNKDESYNIVMKKKELMNKCESYLLENHKEQWVPQLIEKFKLIVNNVHSIAKTAHT